jgi:hypothetical protein
MVGARPQRYRVALPDGISCISGLRGDAQPTADRGKPREVELRPQGPWV